MRILIVTDDLSWAFGNISWQLRQKLTDDIIDIVLTKGYNHSTEELFRGIISKHPYDIVHYLWRGWFWTTCEWLKAVQLTPKEYVFSLELFLKSKIITTIYDEINTPLLEYNNITPIESFQTMFDSYSTSSSKLYNRYRRIPYIRDPAYVTEDGVDLNLFIPQNLDRLKQKNRLIVGWVGNSTWGNLNSEDKDWKGYFGFISPVVDELECETNGQIRKCFAERNECLIPHEEMPKYYNTIDVLVCMSKGEGTPNPILEAMACGVPIITTDVGIVPDLLDQKQKNLIIPRTTDALKQALFELYINPYRRVQLSEENLRQVRGWGWNNKAENMRNFYLNTLSIDDRLMKVKINQAEPIFSFNDEDVLEMSECWGNTTNIDHKPIVSDKTIILQPHSLVSGLPYHTLIINKIFDDFCNESWRWYNTDNLVLKFEVKSNINNEFIEICINPKTGDIETEFVFGHIVKIPTVREWNEYSIPLSKFKQSFTRNDCLHFKFPRCTCQIRNIEFIHQRVRIIPKLIGETNEPVNIYLSSYHDLEKLKVGEEYVMTNNDFHKLWRLHKLYLI